MSNISVGDTLEAMTCGSVSGFTDLRRFADDRTVLKNPHKGWYYHYIDNGFARTAYRDGVRDDEYLTSIPGLNHLYLRIDWCDVEPEKDVFRWDFVDEIFARWSKYGLKFTFRLCTFEGDSDAIPYATPKWVYELGAKGITLTHAVEPDYGDPVYLERLELLMREFGKRYNGDPRVEFIDVGTFGTWGEGHTYAGSQSLYPLWVLKHHVALHLKYFPDTRVMVNDDMIYHAAEQGGLENERAMLEFCAGKGTGVRDDSLNVNGYARGMNYNTLRSEFMFRYFWENSPVDLEFEHYSGSDPVLFRRGYPAIEAMRATHATYAGFHGYADRWLADNSALTDYLANRLGYWYFPLGYRLAECVAGLDSMFTLKLANRGFAAAYDPFTLKVGLVPENPEGLESGEPVCVGEKAGENLRWTPDAEHDCTMRLSLRSVKSGSYGVAIGLFEGETPIKLALNCETRGGWYIVGKTSVE